MTKMFLIYFKKKKKEEEDDEEEEETSLSRATFLKLRYIIALVSGVNKLSPVTGYG